MIHPIQQRAIETLDRNIALVAGAGTGKTRVLTERFLHILKHGGLPAGEETRGIVAITFTRKAAGEMQARILTRLQEESADNPALESLLSQSAQLRISTIHSFCEQLLRANPLATGLDPHFRVIEESETDHWLRAAFYEAYDVWIEDATHFDIAARLGWLPLDSFPDEIIRLYHTIRATGLSQTEVRERTLRFPTPDETVICSVLSQLAEAVYGGKATKAVQESIKDLPGSDRYLKDGQLEGWADFLGVIQQENLLKKGKATEALREQLPHCLNMAEADNEPVYQALLDLLDALDAKYRSFKQEHSALDFDDLQEQVLLLLEDARFRAGVHKEIRYLLIDECQDINGMQHRIFEKIGSDQTPLDRGCLFIVGDPRQSIYGFRHADVTLFESMIAQIEASGGDVLEMSDNFRSSHTVIDYVNRVSEDHFPGRSALRAALEYPEADVLRIDETDKSIPLQNTIATLRHLHDEAGIPWEEMALLFRSGTRMGRVEQTIREAGIPVFSYAAAGVWETQEAMDLEHAFRALLFDEDIAAWLTFLRSPFGGVKDADMVRWSKEKGTWREKVTRRAMAGEEHAVILRDRIQRWSNELRIERVSRLADRWMKEAGYRPYVAGLPGGERRAYGLDTVIQWITEREQTRPESLTTLMEAWKVKRLQAEKSAPDTGDGGAVELFTIHKAKGLEKTVIVFMDVDAPKPYGTAPFLWDEQRGIAVKTDRFGRHLLATETIKEKEAAEDTRILYVALTRAKSRLLLGLREGKKQTFRKILIESGNDPADLPEAPRSNAQSTPKIESDRLEAPLVKHKHLRPKEQEAALHVTQFMLYQQCPFSWALRYPYGLQPDWVATADEFEQQQWERDPQAEGLTGLQRGLLLHDLIERDEGVENAERFVIERAAGLDYTLTREEKERQTSWLCAWRKNKPEGILHKEVPFAWRRNGFLWKGAIDLVAERDGKYTLLDFKTNLRDTEEEMKRRYAPQLRFYAAAWHALSGAWPETAAVWWFPHDKWIRIDLDQAEVQATLDAMDAFAEASANGADLRSELCEKQCEWSELCSIVRHETPPKTEKL